LGTESDKHDNHEIIKIKNTQENAEKHKSQGCDIGMDEFIITFKGKQQCVHFSFCSVGAQIRIFSRILYLFKNLTVL
jgi:hypothetical protein